jgi:hypothetical protein
MKKNNKIYNLVYVYYLQFNYSLFKKNENRNKVKILIRIIYFLLILKYIKILTNFNWTNNIYNTL